MGWSEGAVRNLKIPLRFDFVGGEERCYNLQLT